MRQCDIVLRHLRDHGSITAAEAVYEYGIMRLGARVADLKKAGVPIVSEFERGINRYGERVCYCRYRILQ